MESALKELATYDEANANAESKTALAQFHRGRIPLLPGGHQGRQDPSRID